MNKDHFFERHRNLQLQQQEIERKWRVLQEETELMKLWEAQQSRQQQVSQSFGGGVGNLQLNGFYSFVTEDSGDTGYFSAVNPQGEISIIGNAFNGIAVFCKNFDNGNMYYIEKDDTEEEMVIGIINTSTGERQELDRSILTNASYKNPSSLVYLGNNQFLYLDNNIIFGLSDSYIQRLFILNIDNEGAISIQDGSPILEWDYDQQGAILTTVFEKDSVLWATFTPVGYPFSVLGILNVDTVEIEDANMLDIQGIPYTDTYKPWFVAGISQSLDGKIYVNTIVNDKNTSTLHTSIAEVNPNEYTSTYVQDIMFNLYTSLDIEKK